MTFLLLIALLCLGTWVLWRLFLGYPPARRAHRFVRRREAAFLDAAAEATFPADGPIPLSGREADLPAYADGFLEALPRHLRLQVHAMFLLFEQATIFFPAPGVSGFRRFSSLSLEQRVAVLQGWSHSRLFLRRVVFTALRAVLTMGYLGHPTALRHLRLAPLDFPSPICEADLLYPRIGQLPSSIHWTREDLWSSDGRPLDPNGPLHPDYRGTGRGSGRAGGEGAPGDAATGPGEDLTAASTGAAAGERG